MTFTWELLAPLTASLVLVYLLREDESLNPGELT